MEGSSGTRNAPGDLPELHALTNDGNRKLLLFSLTKYFGKEVLTGRRRERKQE
jgi:hypothetical protein